jgi:hypothetical protein
MASTLNTGGAKLLNSANAVSSSILAGQFIQIFQNEAESMKPEKVVNYWAQEARNAPELDAPRRGGHIRCHLRKGRRLVGMHR